MENDPKPYKFMKESIKKQPPDWKKIVLLIAVWLALAALGGLVAAAVFAVTERGRRVPRCGYRRGCPQGHRDL